MTNRNVLRRARAFATAQTTRLNVPPLGFGDDGTVWESLRHTVIKAFYRRKNYAHELECYQRLKSAGIRKVREFEVPELIRYDDSLMVIEMGFVSPPYILDFGKAHLHDPRWEPHILEEWNERMAEWWGEDAKQVRLALAALKRYGIWYYDAKPGNVLLDSGIAERD